MYPLIKAFRHIQSLLPVRAGFKHVKARVGRVSVRFKRRDDLKQAEENDFSFRATGNSSLDGKFGSFHVQLFLSANRSSVM